MKFLIIGAGLAGCSCARLLADKGHQIILIEKFNSIGGICFDYLAEDNSCYIHKFGPHIFHTFNKDIWNFVNRFFDFNEYIHKGISLYNNKLYSFPVNFNTIFQIFNKRVYSKHEADLLIHDIHYNNPQNFE